MRWTTLWTGKQESGANVHNFKSLLGWSPFQETGTWISWRNVRTMLTNCLEMLVLGTNWTTRHLLVSQQACEISHKMDSGMWPTISKIDLVNSSQKRVPTILSCDKHGTALQTGFVSGLRLCWRSWGLELNLRWCLVHFWKQNICPTQFDVQETNFCLTRSYRVWDYYSGCPDYVWTVYLLLIFGT